MPRNEKIDVRIEVEDDHLMVVFPRKLNDCMVSWQDAWRLGDILERAAADIPSKGLVVNGAAVNIETQQIRLNTHKKKYVVLLVDWTDRVRLSYEAARIVGRAIKLKAQDLDLLSRGVRMDYGVKGRRGLGTPTWQYQRKTFGG